MTWKHTTHRKKVGTTKHGRAGVHGRGRHSGSPIAWAAKQDPWKHKAQAKGQGTGGKSNRPS